MSGRQLLPQDNPIPPIWGADAANSPLDVIVFSKDRACQLDALLRSVRAFFLYPHRIHLLYTTSTPEFELGYDLLRRWHKGVRWIGDKGQFNQTMRKLMAEIDHGPGRYLMFLVDDLIFTRNFTAQGLMESLDEDEDILAVALRMGESITYCYTRDTETRPPDFSGGHRWAWKNASSGYWNYPMSQDAHIFRTSDFAELLPKLNFMSPNTLEAAQSGRPFPRPDLVCEKTASVINIAANRVQSIYPNRCGNTSPEFLNESFLDSLAIDVGPFAGKLYNACHIDVDLPLIDDDRSRKPPKIKRNSDQPCYQIDLRKIPTFVINCKEDKTKRFFMEEQLKDLGLDYEFIEGVQAKPAWVGIVLSHLKVLRLSRARPPYLVLEDDCQFNDNFRHLLEIPTKADALYLGVSTFGLPEPGKIAWSKNNATQWQRYDDRYLRVYNMLARHAVLYLDEGFCRKVVESQVEALSNRNYPHPGDIGLAQLHASFMILTPERSMCRQINRNTTDVNLPDALAGNEIKPEVPDEPATPACEKQEPPPRHSRSDGRPCGQCMVSHKYRFVYFNIGKNASSTLKTEFKRPRYECEQLAVRQLDEAVLRDYYKFTFLRDPVSRAAAAYQEISLRVELNDYTIPKKKFMEMEDNLSRFSAYVEVIGDGSWNVYSKPQLDFIDGIRMDFYGRVESLQGGLERVFDTLGMGPCPNLPMRRSRAGRKNDYGYDKFNIAQQSLPTALVDRLREVYRMDVDLIQALCPEPALQSTGCKKKKSSQAIALPLAVSGDLSPIELFVQVNEKHENCLVYCLGDRGFYAEISTVARAMIYAWVHGLQLLLDSSDFVWSLEQGWKDYFEPFCLSPEDIDPARISERIEFTRSGDREPFNRVLGFMPEELVFGQTRLSGFQNILAFFHKMIFRPVKECQALIAELTNSLNLPAEYDAIHVRRGDKVGDEDVYYPVSAYLDRLKPLQAGRTLFVMSDAYQAVEEVRALLGKEQSFVRVVSLVEKGSTGFDVWKLRRGEQFMGDEEGQDEPQQRRAYIKEQTWRLLAETSVAVNASRFVSTWLSNVGRTVWYLHPDQQRCHLLQKKDHVAEELSIEQPDEPHASRAYDPGGQRAEQDPQLILFRCLNEGLKDCVVYCLGGRGLFEEFTTLARAMIYALVNQRQLLLDATGFEPGGESGWTDLFQPFCLAPGDVDSFRIKERISFQDKAAFDSLMNFEPDKLNFGQVQIEGFPECVGFFMRMIFRAALACRGRIESLLTGLAPWDVFDVIHIGPNDGDSPDDERPAVEDYLKRLTPMPDYSCLCLITEDEDVMHKVRIWLARQPKKVHLFSLFQAGEDSAFDRAVRQLVEISLVMRARHFVSAVDTSLGRIAKLMLPNRDCCDLLRTGKLRSRRPAGPRATPRKYLAEVQLRDGRLYRLELPSESPLLTELRLLAAGNERYVESQPARLVQLPLDNGRAALAFSSRDISSLRLIPAGEMRDSGGGRHGAVPQKKKTPTSKIRQSAHPAMNIDEGHLGGYIRSRHPTSTKFAMEHGDLETWTPELWQWVHDELKVRSVVDVGCGEGHAAAYFRDLGCRVLGIDGSVQAERDTVIPEVHLRHDYVDGPFIPDEYFDMVWCCEFVEHVEERHTQNFLATFSRARKYVMMTFAPPGQSGWHHVNCQRRQYWIEKLERLGFKHDEEMTEKARSHARKGHFKHKGLVFVRRDRELDRSTKGIPTAKPESTANTVVSVASRDRFSPLPVNDMEIVTINGHRFYLFLDIFVHPLRSKIVAVLPYYDEDWNPDEHAVDVEKVDLAFVSDKDPVKVRGTFIPHRLDSWEPCALLDFEHPELADLLRKSGKITFTVKVGPHAKTFTLSTVPEPARNVLMSLVVRNENRWIRHFLEYYLKCLHVDHVLVYDNGTADHDGLLEILRPYQKAGSVTFIPWDYRWRNVKPRKMIAQPQQEAHSLNRFANSRWIGFMDVDEFLRIPGKTLPGFLHDFVNAQVDGLSFGLRWFRYQGALEFDEIIDPPLTFLHAHRDELGRKRQKLLVSPRRLRFLRLHTLEEGGRELQVDDTDIYFHHYCQRECRFEKSADVESFRDDYMLQFAGQLSLEGTGTVQPDKPRTAGQWITHIRRAIAEAESGRSRLNEEALRVNGLCGVITRHFYNNICNFKDCHFLEIGCLEGASISAAICGNSVAAICIDNFSQFHGSREKFESNIAPFLASNRVHLIEQDCFELDIKELGPFDVYLYDGGHSRECHYKAIEHFVDTLADYAVVIIDDWNWSHVREGTRDALRDLGNPVLYKKEIILPGEDIVDMPRHAGSDGWWNGICIMLLGRASQE